MKWTTETPKESGWYWIRGSKRTTPFPLYNEPEKDFQGTVFQKASVMEYYGSEIGTPYECFGPIPQPPLK